MTENEPSPHSKPAAKGLGNAVRAQARAKSRLGAVVALATVLGVAAIFYVAQQRSMRDSAIEQAVMDQVFAGYGIPRSAYGRFLAGRYAQGRRDLAAAADAFSNAAELSKDPLMAVTAMHANIMHGQFDRALKAAMVFSSAPVHEDSGISVHDSMTASLLVILEHVRKGEWDQARLYAADELKKPRLLPFQMLVFEVARAWASLALGDADSALAGIEALSRGDRRSTLLAYQQGLMLLQAQRYEEANALFEKMILQGNGLMPRRVVEVYAAGLAAQGRQEEAREIVKKYDEAQRMISGWSVPTLMATTVTGSRLPDYLTRPSYGVADMLYGIASLARQQGNAEMATQFLQMALYVEPSYDAARILLAAIWSDQEFYSLALEQYRKIPNASPYGLFADLNASTALMGMKRFNDAIERLRKLAQHHGEHASVWLHLGDALRRSESFADAAKAYSRVIELAGDDAGEDLWAVYYMRGICYERSKQWDQAESDFHKALELSPDQPDVLNYLAYSWLERDEHLNEALEMLQKAVEQRPTDAHILDSYGWAYFKLQQYDQALDYIQQAVELMPDDATVTSHYGDVLWHIGRRREAYYEWQRALNFDPTPEDKAQLTRKLEEGYVGSTQSARR